MKTFFTILCALSVAGSAFAGTYRVHYSIHGSGKNITIQADNSSEARETVEDMFPDAVVTNVSKVH